VVTIKNLREIVSWRGFLIQRWSQYYSALTGELEVGMLGQKKIAK
jgi:hypothetical protein